MLVEAFEKNIFPYMIQIGVIFFVFALCQFGYALFRRPDWQQFLDKFKASIFAYALVRGSFVIVNFIDKVIDGMYKGEDVAIVIEITKKCLF